MNKNGISEKMVKAFDELIEIEYGELQGKVHVLELEVIDRNCRIEKLADINEKLNDQIEAFGRIAKVFTEEVGSYEHPITKLRMVDHILDLINNDTNLITGMSVEDIPRDIYVMAKHYKHKDLVLDLYRIFDIDYYKGLDDFLLPRDFSESEIKRIVENELFITTNSEYWSNNYDFFLGKSYVDDPFATHRKYPLQELVLNKHFFKYKHELISSKRNRHIVLYGLDHLDLTKSEVQHLLLEMLNGIDPKYRTGNDIRNAISPFMKKVNRHWIYEKEEVVEILYPHMSLSTYGSINFMDFPDKYKERKIKENSLEDNILLFKNGYITEDQFVHAVSSKL